MWSQAAAGYLERFRQVDLVTASQVGPQQLLEHNICPDKTRHLKSKGKARQGILLIVTTVLKLQIQNILGGVFSLSFCAFCCVGLCLEPEVGREAGGEPDGGPRPQQGEDPCPAGGPGQPAPRHLVYHQVDRITRTLCQLQQRLIPTQLLVSLLPKCKHFCKRKDLFGTKGTFHGLY